MNFALGTKIFLGFITVPATVGTAVWATRDRTSLSTTTNDSFPNKVDVLDSPRTEPYGSGTDGNNPIIDPSDRTDDVPVEPTGENLESEDRQSIEENPQIPVNKQTPTWDDSDFVYVKDEEKHNDTYIFQDEEKKCEVLVMNKLRNSPDMSQGLDRSISKDDIAKMLKDENNKRRVKEACSKTNYLRLYVVKGKQDFYTNEHPENNGGNLVLLG